MSDAKEDVKFSLKATVIKKRGKVLFAEVDSGFADVVVYLFSLNYLSVMCFNFPFFAFYLWSWFLFVFFFE